MLDVVRQFKSSILEKLPTQSRRDSEMDDFQQFSTPPTLAYVSSWVANINNGDTMMEPSAGTGDLAVYAHNAGARLVLNELDVASRCGAEEPLSECARLHGKRLAIAQHPGVKPTVVVMNPPFSSTAGRKQGERNSKNGAMHIEQALKRLAKGGRLVAIMGEGMGYDRPAFRSWYANIQKDYNVRAVIGIDGREYMKYGTTFDNVILVIDKDGPQRGEVLTGKVDRVEALPELLESIRADRPQVDESDRRGEPPADQPNRKENPDAGSDSAGDDGVVPGDADSVGGGRGASGKGSRSGNRGGGSRKAGSGNGGRADDGTGPDPGNGSDGRGDAAAAGASGHATSDVAVGDRGAQKATGEFTDSIFEQYAPQRLTIAGRRRIRARWCSRSQWAQSSPRRRAELPRRQEEDPRILPRERHRLLVPRRQHREEQEEAHSLHPATGLRADAAVQGFGRTYRTNQAQPPEYVLCMTTLKAKKRLVSSIPRRLDQFGALTRGQRQATSQGLFSAADNFDSSYQQEEPQNGPA